MGNQLDSKLQQNLDQIHKTMIAIKTETSPSRLSQRNVLQPRDLQEMFLQCVEAFLKSKNKPRREFETISSDKKTAALTEFLSNK